MEVVRGSGHALLRPLAPRLVGGEPLSRGLLGRVAGARALLARLVGVGVGIGHPQHGVTTLTTHQEGAGGAESSKCGYLTCNTRMVSSLHGQG